MSGKSQTIGDFTASRLSQILPTNENSKSIVDMPDNPGWTGTNLENRECSYFPATHPRFLRWSAIIPDKSKLKFVPSETLAVDFAHYQSPLNHASFNFWRTFHFRPNSSGESESDLWRLSDISGTVGEK